MVSEVNNELTNQIYEAFERNSLTIGVFIDLKKAFHRVTHSIPLDKLNFYGIQGTLYFSVLVPRLCEF